MTTCCDGVGKVETDHDGRGQTPKAEHVFGAVSGVHLSCFDDCRDGSRGKGGAEAEAEFG